MVVSIVPPRPLPVVVVVVVLDEERDLLLDELITSTQFSHDDCLRVVIYFLLSVRMIIVPHRVPGGLKHWIGWRI